MFSIRAILRGEHLQRLIHIESKVDRLLDGKIFGGHPDQASATTPALDRFRILALTKLLADDRLSEARRAAVVEVLVEKCRIYAGGLARRGRVNDARMYEAVADCAPEWRKGSTPEIGCTVHSMRSAIRDIQHER